jgi:hypothetical protein
MSLAMDDKNAKVDQVWTGVDGKPAIGFLRLDSHEDLAVFDYTRNLPAQDPEQDAAIVRAFRAGWRARG